MKDDGYLYYDDSKHPDSDFYLGAFVYSDYDLNSEISDYISNCGLDPSTDEFKSCLRMDRNPKYKELRKYLNRMIKYINIAVVITAPNDIDFKEFTCKALIRLFENNQETLLTPLNIYLDEGIFKGTQDESYKLTASMFDRGIVNLFIEQDSKIIKGIQLADLVAHSCSIMLKETLGHLNKTLKAGENSGYEPETGINIGFEMWAGLRQNFFSSSPPDYSEVENHLDFKAKVLNKGLFISESCSEIIKVKGIERFGEMYLGCIH